jgi:hypothetical protein
MPQQVASLPHAAAAAGGNFDGRYTTTYKSGRGTYKATIEVQGKQIAGFMEITGVGAYSSMCRLAGGIDLGSGEVPRLDANCGSTSSFFTGRFSMGGDGKIVGETKTKTGFGETVDAHWLEEGPPPASRGLAPSTTAAVASPFDGQYQGKFTLGSYIIQATLEIAGQKISGSGFSMRPGSTTASHSACRVSGAIDASGKVQRLEFRCPDVDVNFTGSFAPDAQTGKVAGNTNGRSPMHGSADVLWARN